MPLYCSHHLPMCDHDRCGPRTLSKIMKKHVNWELTQLYMRAKKKKGGRTRGPTEVPANRKYSATLNWAMKNICKHSLLLFIYLVSEALHVA